jgi:CRP/FNR family transcriptional regulator
MQAMHRHVNKLMSGEIIRESGLMTMLGIMTVQERVTVFLVNWSKGLAVRGFSAMNFICE